MAQHKQVGFDKVYIREHAVIVGDTRKDCKFPLALDWKHAKHERIFDIDRYEAYRRQHGHRTGRKLQKANEFDRRFRLKQMGMTDRALIAAEKQRQRNRLLANESNGSGAHSSLRSRQMDGPNVVMPGRSLSNVSPALHRCESTSLFQIISVLANELVDL